MKHLALFCTLFLLAFQSGRQPAPAKAPDKTPKNVILMIGDGMGVAQITAALYANGGKLNLSRFPFSGMIQTHSAKNIITDSAASATAFSCGCKTLNGVLAMTADKKPCPTILEQAEAQGLATGLVVTCSITHATPAAFIAHVRSRSSMEEIATWFLKTNIDLFIGGGMKYFTDRADGRNLYEELQKKGYTVGDFTQQTLFSANPSASKPFAWFSAKEEPVYVSRGRDYLPVASHLAPEFLQQRSTKGFFLMIEGSQIDWACHANKADDAVREMQDFDTAIGEVLKFAEKDGETLVIVTADHETGGMALLQGDGPNELEIKFTTDYHTATMVPVFAYGPGAQMFSGVYDNTEIYRKMHTLLKLPPAASSK